MKIWFRNIKSNSILILLLLASSLAMSREAAVVTSIEGNVFAINEGKIWELQVNEVIDDFTEISTEEGSQISLSDFHDHKFHLSGSTNIKFLNRIIELKKGYIWIQSQNNDEPLTVQTTNSNTEVKRAEIIVSFDVISGKSQALAINGENQFSNLLEDHLKVDLPPGTFSFVDDAYENGVPRKPTQVGFNSFSKVLSLFRGVRPLKENQRLFEGPKRENHQAERSIASTSNTDLIEDKILPPEVVERISEKKVQSGKITIIKQVREFERAPSSFSMEKFYSNEIKEIKKEKRAKDPRDYSKKSDVKLKMYGLKVTSKHPKSRSRSPASAMNTELVQSRPPIKMLDPKNFREPAETEKPKVDPFEKTLLKEYKLQLRHSNELNDLIDELKSYKGNYKKEH